MAPSKNKKYWSVTLRVDAVEYYGRIESMGNL
jgi:hypothetical protein